MISVTDFNTGLIIAGIIAIVIGLITLNVKLKD